MQTSWTDDETQALGKALTFAYKAQNTYKEELDLKDRVRAWKFILGEYPMNVILAGLKEFLRENDEMPVPANIKKIIDPKPKEISTAEYVQACKWQEANGFPMFSEAKDTIDKFKKQESDARAPLFDQPIHPLLKSRLDDEIKKIEKGKSNEN